MQHPISPLTSTLDVLFVVQSYGGGVFSVLRDVATPLVERHGIHLTIVYSPGSDTPADHERQMHPNVALIVLPFPSTQLSIRNLVGIGTSARKLAGLIRQRRPDVVHLHSTIAGLVGRAASRLSYRSAPHRLYYTPHGLSSLRSGDSTVKRLAYRFAESLGHAMGGEVVACSHSERDEYATAVWGGQRRNRTVVENGIARPRPTPTSPSSASSDGRVVVATLGRVTEQKQPTAVARLARSFPSIRFVWIGDGKPEYVRDLEDAGVEVTGWLDKQSVWDRLGTADVYVQYSAWEGLSIALLEAMMLSLPVIASDIPANRGVIVDDVTGLLASSEQTLADALKRLAYSSTLRQRLGQAARERATKRYSIDRMADELARLYAPS